MASEVCQPPAPPVDAVGRPGGHMPAGTPTALAAVLVRLGLRRQGFDSALAALSRGFMPRWLHLDPSRVSGAIDTKHWERRHNRATVLDGDWDLVRVERPIISRTVAQLADGVPYTETEQFVHMLRVIESGSGRWNYRCQTGEDVHAYFDRLLAAWTAIRAGDYRTQEELGGRRNDEIAIHIDRDGEPVIGQYGNHRLEMARAAALPSVPVLLRTVHLRAADRWHDRWGAPLETALVRGLEELAVPAAATP